MLYLLGTIDTNHDQDIKTIQRDGGNDEDVAFIRWLSPPETEWNPQKRLAPAAGTFEFCGEGQRVSALIADRACTW
jgi:hypothetical protein